MRVLFLAAVAALVVGCGASASAVLRQAEREHGCWDARVDGRTRNGYWIDVCGDLRYYEERSGRFVEDEARAIPRSARIPGAGRGSGEGGCSVHVGGYTRRDGTRVRAHTRRCPR